MTDLATVAHAGTSLVQTLLSYWWLFLIFGGAVLEWIGETFNVGLTALRRRARNKRKHQLDLKRLELEIAQARAGGNSPAAAPAPGPCAHRRVVPVMSDEKVIAWLCRSCDTQLPADWAVREEDL